MNPVIVGIALYLLIGIILLALFDLKTRRIRTKFTQATSETQLKLATSGSYVGGRVAGMLFVSAMCLFWPMVFVGAITDRKSKEEDSRGA